MAQSSENILEKARRSGLAVPSAGMKVPAGYFDDFARQMDSLLPYRAEIENPQEVDRAMQPRTFWQKVQPYVYMAAMFAGVWCMLQMFASIGRHTSLSPMDSNPVLAKAFDNDQFMNDYIYDDINSWDLFDEMVEDGTFENDSAIDAFFSTDGVMEADEQTDYLLPE